MPESNPAGFCIYLSDPDPAPELNFVKNWTRCQAKFLTCEISDFIPCAHPQTNIPHVKYAKKSDD